MYRVEVKSKKGNVHYKWTFYVSEETLWLDTYSATEIIPPKRTGEKLVYYNRLSERDSTITEVQVPLPDEIKEEALESYIKLLSVKKWSERGR